MSSRLFEYIHVDIWVWHKPKIMKRALFFLPSWMTSWGDYGYILNEKLKLVI